MRTLYFLVPGTGGKFACGGLWAELKTLDLAKQVCTAEVATYRQREQNTRFLDDLLQESNLQDSIFVLSWGFDVAQLAAKLHRQHVIYHAHSAGYGFSLPVHIPIITVSRNTLGYWGQKAPHSLIYYLPNLISHEFHNRQGDRDLDVLVQARKSSEYLLHDLIPALQQKCRVEVVNSYVEDLPGLFNRAKIYLYDSAEYWAQQRVSEGFGLQPLEAIACGCQVFSSVNGGLSDYLDPGFNAHKIACYSKEYDVQRILQTLNASPVDLPDEFFAEHRGEAIVKRLTTILNEINYFFDHRETHPSTIQPLTQTRLIRLNAKRLFNKLKQKLFSGTSNQ
ncbi:MAG: glycosyltransferase [Leptolyngbyaceae cyanobacterium CRU_2_3]|nr:glycosyltransferase [Leptolyngbyaceae cyanobacterium CRU_2_3]